MHSGISLKSISRYQSCKSDYIYPPVLKRVYSIILWVRPRTRPKSRENPKLIRSTTWRAIPHRKSTTIRNRKATPYSRLLCCCHLGKCRAQAWVSYKRQSEPTISVVSRKLTTPPISRSLVLCSWSSRTLDACLLASLILWEDWIPWNLSCRPTAGKPSGQIPANMSQWPLFRGIARQMTHSKTRAKYPRSMPNK